jgi:hypothetical protein
MSGVCLLDRIMEIGKRGRRKRKEYPYVLTKFWNELVTLPICPWLAKSFFG